MPSLNYEHQQQAAPSVLAQWSEEHETTLCLRFPVHRACRDGDITSLNHLLRSAASEHRSILETQDPICGWTPGIWAAFFGQLECVQLLSPAGLEPRSANGQTVLHAAALGARPNCLHWMLQLGAPHHLTDDLGETALHKAARSKSYECSRILAVCGVDYSVRNNAGLTAAQLAELEGGMPENNESRDGFECKESPVCHISSNAYYGYQPIPSNTNVQKIGTNGVHSTAGNCITNGTNGYHHDDNSMDEDVSSNAYGNNHCNLSVLVQNGCTADMNIRKRSLQESMCGSDVKRMRHEELAPIAHPETSPPAPREPTTVPSTSGTASNRMCEFSYPRCMMGHYM